MIRASGTRSPPAAPDGRRTAYTRIVAQLGYRLISLVTAIIVAACPTLFAVCEERCGHNARRAAGPTHLHQAGGELGTREAPTRAGLEGREGREGLEGLEGQIASVTTDQEEAPCHRTFVAATSLAPEATGAAAFNDTSHAEAALNASTESTSSRVAHLASTCSQCFGDAPVLLAARSADDHSRSLQRDTDAAALLPVVRVSAAAFERLANAHLSRNTPPSPQSAPLVLRI